MASGADGDGDFLAYWSATAMSMIHVPPPLGIAAVTSAIRVDVISYMVFGVFQKEVMNTDIFVASCSLIVES